MEKGWDAKGKLKPLWERLPGKRDELARLTGITGGTLSAYNSGSRRLGLTNGLRIADALNVTVLELGAPEELADQAGRTLLDRLQVIEAKLDGLATRGEVHAATQALLAAIVHAPRQETPGSQQQSPVDAPNEGR